MYLIWNFSGNKSAPDKIYDVVWYDISYNMIYILLKLGWHPVVAVQYTFTHKQYTGYRERNIHNNPKI
jgi:hypothetical protein